MTHGGPASAVPGVQLVLNGAFRPQRVSGQQRYAIEIGAELLRRPGVTELRPPNRAAGRAGSWAWTQTALPLAARGRPLLSLTSRAPAFCRAHAVTVHDLFPLAHPEWYSRAYLALHVPLLERHLRHADLLVTVSAPVADAIRERVRRDDVVLAPNAPSAVFAAPADGSDSHVVDSVLARLGRGELAGREGFVLTVGSRDPRKNLARLVQAHLSLPVELRRAFPLFVAGGTWDTFAPTEILASDEVAHLGYVSDTELAALYRTATAVVFPSLDEGFGLPVVEAAVAGARVVLSDIAVFRWVGGADVDYFDPTDVAAIASALTDALTGESDGARAQRLRDAVRERFSWTASADAIHDAIGRRWAAR